MAAAFFSILLSVVFFASSSGRSDVPPAQPGGVLTVWANDGGDKVTRDEQRATRDPKSVVNPIWDGGSVRVSGARNEVADFNLILEAPRGANRVTVRLRELVGPGGFRLRSGDGSKNGIFRWTSRQIELFYIRYLAVRGLSIVHYDTYDERQIPRRLQRPYTGEGEATGTWKDRPDHDKSYPDIAVPIELQPTFSIAPKSNQSIWFDIYIPKKAPPGEYRGEIRIAEQTRFERRVPVVLTVSSLTLPDVPSAKTMLYYSQDNVNRRYFGADNPRPEQERLARAIRDRHFEIAHRHRISLIDTDCPDSPDNHPCPEWFPRLSGGLFTPAHGYDGPGVGIGNGVYSIGTYGTWAWKAADEGAMWRNADDWVMWFGEFFPKVDYFLYLADESEALTQTERWARWIHADPGPGKRLKAFATVPAPEAVMHIPSLDIDASTLGVGITKVWQKAADHFLKSPGREFFLYNGTHPASGSFSLDDDGVALREIPWVQFKMGVQRWFYWESTYYNNSQGGMGETDVFRNAQTFGISSRLDPVLGRTGWNYGNGEGVLFYPGTDRLFPDDSYEVSGPIVSLRLKYWRKGLQDFEYLKMAQKVSPERVRALVERMVPKAVWEYGVTDLKDPTWVRTGLSWPTDPKAWIAARKELQAIIEGH